MKILDYGIFKLEITGNRATMNFNTGNPKYPTELIESSFQRELRFISALSNYAWAPQNVTVHEKTISFDWFGEPLDQTELPIDWKKQLEQIVRDLKNNNIYKPNFYQKCFYVDSKGQIHAFSFYSTSTKDEQPIDMSFYTPILNEDRLTVVDELSNNSMLDMSVLIERAYTDYIKWPDDALNEIYNNVYK